MKNSASEPLGFRTRAKNYSFSESSEPFFDRLDIFSDATDLKNTLVLLLLRHLTPIIDSECKWFPNRALATILAKPGGNAQKLTRMAVRQDYYDNINI